MPTTTIARCSHSSHSWSPDEPTSLYFVTDEIAVFMNEKRVVCDLLALNRHDGRMVPVIIELKSTRDMKRLVEQLENYAAVISTYQIYFERLFSALLAEPIRFSMPVEKWLVWPSPKSGPVRRVEELAAQGIRVVDYAEKNNAFTFSIGARPR